MAIQEKVSTKYSHCHQLLQSYHILINTTERAHSQSSRIPLKSFPTIQFSQNIDDFMPKKSKMLHNNTSFWSSSWCNWDMQEDMQRCYRPSDVDIFDNFWGFVCHRVQVSNPIKKRTLLKGNSSFQFPLRETKFKQYITDNVFLHLLLILSCLQGQMTEVLNSFNTVYIYISCRFSCICTDFSCTTYIKILRLNKISYTCDSLTLFIEMP